MSSSGQGSGGHYDVIVIGGGPSGMMAAGTAIERGRRVLLIEKNKELGKKLSITGGGRCNITNAESDIHAFLKHYGDAAKYLYSPFSQFGVDNTFHFFESKNLPLVVEARKRAFPKSQRASDVVKAMKRFASQSGVTIKTGTRVNRFIRDGGRIVGVDTTSGAFTADSFVLATGGVSHPETGSTGDGFRWLKELDLSVREPNPDIVPLVVENEWVKALSGTTLSFMKITFGDGKQKFSKTGKILFTHFGLSGPLILNSAREVKKVLKNGPVPTTIDLYPDTEIGTLRNRVLAVFDQNKNKALKNVLKDFVPEGMQEAVAAQLDGELLETKVHSVSKGVRNELVDRLKAMPLTVTGTLGLDKAVVSDGGIDLNEIDMKTMASKKYPNLFVTGDMLNINRPSGGFSLQLCWTTGHIAGKNV